MAATQTQQDPDRTTTEDKPADSDNMKEQAVAVKNESVSPNAPQDAVSMGQPRDTAGQMGSFAPSGDRIIQSTDVYAPQAQPFYYKDVTAGYENAAGQWDEYPLYANHEGFDVGSPAVYNDNSSLLFHGGYGYNPQMPYGPFSPVTTPVPSLGGDAQLFSPQQYPFSGPPYYQPLGPPNMPYITSPTPSHTDLTTLVSVDQHGDSMIYGPQHSYPSPVGSMGGGNFSGNPATLNFHDFQQGFDGTRSGSLWSDFSKPADRHRSLAPISPAASPQPIGTPFGQNIGMAPQQQRPHYGLGSGSNTYNRGYPQSGFNQGSSYGNVSIPGLGINPRGWLSIDHGRRRGRGSTSLCGCIGGIDILSEQNRGPRASKPKAQIVPEHGTSADDKKGADVHKLPEGLYNQPDFITEYADAKFFVIKSYSEDNVHKSIKYGVWASTPNGNKKLDAAYREAKEKQDPCPVFLFFSVNASAQFCGVAEMVGPVDFEKSVDYWQQDKWSGQFPLKWHIIKDVPNSQFRHILLENNDNKPVTNSRDTQGVKLEQGIEILNILKKYENETSILDDFDFYEEREKAMREQKARQQGVVNVGVIGENEHKTAVTLSNDFVKHMSKSFAQVVRLDEGNKDVSATEKASSVSDGRTRVKPEDTVAGTVSPAQSS